MQYAFHTVRVIETEVLKSCAIPVSLTIPARSSETETKNCSYMCYGYANLNFISKVLKLLLAKIHKINYLG